MSSATNNSAPAKQTTVNDNNKSPVSPNNIPTVHEPGTSLDFDDVLPHLGEFGKYQKLLFLLLAPFMFFVAFVYFSQIFITLTPEHWCNIPELPGSTAHER